jgi:hypothetical protein
VPYRYLIVSLDCGLFYHIEECDWRDMWHGFESGELQVGFRWEVLRGRSHLKNVGVDERILLKDTGLIWLGMGTDDGLF